MASFVLGDELGNIKLLRYNSKVSEANHIDLKLVYPQILQHDGPSRSVQKIAVKHSGHPDLVNISRLHHPSLIIGKNRLLRHFLMEIATFLSWPKMTL